MSLHYAHKPNYFLYAQLIVRHIQNYVQKNQNTSQLVFELNEINALFQDDFASVSVNLDGIMNIADEYKVETLSGDQKLIQHYNVDVKNAQLLINCNPEALQSLRDGKPLIEPDATIQE